MSNFSKGFWIGAGVAVALVVVGTVAGVFRAMV